MHAIGGRGPSQEFVQLAHGSFLLIDLLFRALFRGSLDDGSYSSIM
jgi:hypothetical protein